jgi:hypothetical protein
VPATWGVSFEKALGWGAYVIAHAFVAMLVIAAIGIVQGFLSFIGDPKLFDKVPIRYIFDGMDVAILVGFFALTALEAVWVFREQRR